MRFEGYLDRERRSAEGARCEWRSVIGALSDRRQRRSPAERESLLPGAECCRADGKDERTPCEGRVLQILVILVITDMAAGGAWRFGKVSMDDCRVIPVAGVVHVFRRQQRTSGKCEERHNSDRSAKSGSGQPGDYAGGPAVRQTCRKSGNTTGAR